jgi:hypothetical protein
MGLIATRYQIHAVYNNTVATFSMDMAAKTSNRLDDKDSFVDLTPKQKVVVKALAGNPDAGAKEIAEIASANLENDTVSRSYVHPIKDKYGHIVENQRELLENKRTQGESKTTGDPLESLEERLGQDETWQTIKERPNKETVQTANEELESTISVELGQEAVRELLNNKVSEDTKREVIEALFRQAF